MTMVARIERVSVRVIKFLPLRIVVLDLWRCEHRSIQSLRTIRSFGTNTVDPFGLPLLDPP